MDLNKKHGLLRKLCFRTFLTQNQDPGHYLPVRRSGLLVVTVMLLHSVIIADI